MRKKLTAAIVFLLVLLIVLLAVMAVMINKNYSSPSTSLDGSNSPDKNVRLGYTAMESGDYERAKKLYSYAISKGNASDGDKLVYEVICAYLDAGDALEAEDFAKGLEIINAVSFNYSSLNINKDIESLTASLNTGLDADDKLAALGRAIDDGNLGMAEDMLSELRTMKLTSRQEDRLYSYSRAIHSANSGNDEEPLDEEDFETDNGENEDEGNEVDEDKNESEDENETDEPKEDSGESVNVNYTVKVDVSKLDGGSVNIHSGPGSSYPVSGTIEKTMVLTIVQEEGGWGKLKSGAGWIDLSCCS